MAYSAALILNIILSSTYDGIGAAFVGPRKIKFRYSRFEYGVFMGIVQAHGCLLNVKSLSNITIMGEIWSVLIGSNCAFQRIFFPLFILTQQIYCYLVILNYPISQYRVIQNFFLSHGRKTITSSSVGDYAVSKKYFVTVFNQVKLSL